MIKLCIERFLKKKIGLIGQQTSPLRSVAFCFQVVLSEKLLGTLEIVVS